MIHEPTPTPTPTEATTGTPRTSWLTQIPRWLVRSVGRSIVFVVGMSVVGAGIAMLVLPGPGILVVLGGLLILATQFAWAERALDKVSESAASAANKASASRGGRFVMAISATGMVIGGGFVVLVDNGTRFVGIGLALAGLIGLAFAVLQFPHIGRDPQEDPT